LAQRPSGPARGQLRAQRAGPTGGPRWEARTPRPFKQKRPYPLSKSHGTLPHYSTRLVSCIKHPRLSCLRNDQIPERAAAGARRASDGGAAAVAFFRPGRARQRPRKDPRPTPPTGARKGTEARGEAHRDLADHDGGPARAVHGHGAAFRRTTTSGIKKIKGRGSIQT
jgi:hypothetical protein